MARTWYHGAGGNPQNSPNPGQPDTRHFWSEHAVDQGEGRAEAETEQNQPDSPSPRHVQTFRTAHAQGGFDEP